jgi:hypothetical protein
MGELIVSGLVAGIWLQKALSGVRGCGLRSACLFCWEERRSCGDANGKKGAAWEFGAEHVKRSRAAAQFFI